VRFKRKFVLFITLCLSLILISCSASLEDTSDDDTTESTQTETVDEEVSSENTTEVDPTENQTEESPTVDTTEETTTNDSVEDDPSENITEETSSENETEVSPTENVSEDTPSENQTEETPTENSTEDDPSENITEETPSEDSTLNELTLTEVTSQLYDLFVPSFDEKAIVIINSDPNPDNSSQSVSNIPTSRLNFLSSVRSNRRLSKQKFIKDYQSSRQTSMRHSKANKDTLLSKASSTISSLDDTYTFYSENLVTGFIKAVDASLVYGDADTTCLIYVEEGSESETDWDIIGTYFDSTIYPRVTEKFGQPLDVDNNDKIVILYSTFENNKIVGYFFAGDLFSENDVAYSNEMEILYMNVLTVSYQELNYETLAHEFQHLTNASEAISNGHSSLMDTWLNEALAESAAHYALESVIDYHIENMEESQVIANGLSVTQWTGTFEDYTMSYLFSEYLKNLATNREDIFIEMIQTNSSGITQVETAMNGEHDTLSTIEEFLEHFRLANILQGNGVYGYGEDSSLFSFNTIPAPSSYSSEISLNPGGAIVIYPNDTDFDSFSPTDSGTDIIIYKVHGNE